MGLGGQPPPGGSGAGHGTGPFGEKGFRAGIAICVVSLVVGLLMMLGGGAIDDVGICLVILAVLGLVTGGLGRLAERHALRRAAARAPEPPPSPRAPAAPAERSGHGNGRVPPARRKER